MHYDWLQSADDSDNQMLFLFGGGCRVIDRDRLGHGRSTQTAIFRFDGNK
ncbi:hypothetical protein [Methylobacterium crusticola]|nr:hypothetical protein [Methylobacterium crusticola]